MKVLVVYDSVFGNTAKIAQAIKSGLEPYADARLIQAQEISAATLIDINVLIVGSPTRGFRPTEAVQDLLSAIDPKALNHVKVAAFDTRFKADELRSATTRFIVKTGGYAAKRIASQLEKAGGSLIAPPEGFYVEDIEGPLKEGELERAEVWGRALLAHT
jgi:flavodoxin